MVVRAVRRKSKHRPPRPPRGSGSIQGTCGRAQPPAAPSHQKLVLLADLGHQHLSLLKAEVGLLLFCMSGARSCHPAMEPSGRVFPWTHGRQGGLWCLAMFRGGPWPWKGTKYVGVCGLSSGGLLESLFGNFQVRTPLPTPAHIPLPTPV